MTFLKILTKEEQVIFDHPPEFTSDERKRFFHISKWMEAQIDALGSPTNRVGFVLLHGYFRASKRFFSPKLFNPNDTEYVAYKLGIDLAEVDLMSYAATSTTLNRHRDLILRKRKYQAFAMNQETADDTGRLFHRAPSLPAQP